MQLYGFLLLMQSGIYISIFFLSFKLMYDHYECYQAISSSSSYPSCCFGSAKIKDFTDKLSMTSYYYYISQVIEVIIGFVLIVLQRSKHQSPLTSQLVIPVMNLLVRMHPCYYLFYLTSECIDCLDNGAVRWWGRTTSVPHSFSDDWNASECNGYVPYNFDQS
jgi:hypothetical protein